MSNQIKQVLDKLGKAAQQVGGRVIAVVDGKHQDIVNASGELTEAGRALLTDESAPAKRGRKPKTEQPPAGDIAADLRGLLDADDEGGEDE